MYIYVNMNLIYPLSTKGSKTSGFGPRNGAHHNGIDIGVPDGTGVNSVADGEVVRADMKNYYGYGNFIIIKHDLDGETFYSAYAHLTKMLVSVGDKVKQGDQIALSGGGQGLAGGGGKSTGPHLHFEIRKSKNGNWVNPESYISGKEIVKGDLNKTQDDNEVPDKSTISNLVVTYNNLTGKSKDIADTVVSQLKKIGITNPYTIIVICSILIKKYGTITESFILGKNKIKIPRDGAHKGQSGWQSNNAWDIAVPIGTPVYAVNSGTVVTFTNHGPNIIRKNGKKIFGTGFTVKTDNKLPSVFYTHLKDTTISKGSKISCGQLLGYVMDFPGSSYDHLHIGVETGNIRQFITDDGTLKCKSKYMKNDEDENPTKSEGNTLPPQIQKLMDKLKSKWGVTITQKHIDAEFKQEGNIRPDNGHEDSQAKKKIEELIKDCKLANPIQYPDDIVSGYRSYTDQVDNFGSKAKKRGIENTQASNCLPGFSQHHTGKTFDIFSTDTSWWDKNSKVKKWVADNCENYGFEVTYKSKGSLRIAEPWHLYYTGGGTKNNNDVLLLLKKDLELLTNNKETINNFKTLDECIKYYSSIELSDGSTLSKDSITEVAKQFRVEVGTKNTNDIDIKSFLKNILSLPVLGAKIRKERGLSENTQLNEEIYRIKDLMKKII